MNNYHYILSNHTLASLTNVFSIIYLCTLYFACAFSKWGTIFKYYFLFLAAAVAEVSATAMVPSTNMYESL